MAEIGKRVELNTRILGKGQKRRPTPLPPKPITLPTAVVGLAVTGVAVVDIS